MERDEARADSRLKARFMSTVSHDAGDQGKSALVRTRCLMSTGVRSYVIATCQMLLPNTIWS